MTRFDAHIISLQNEVNIQVGRMNYIVAIFYKSRIWCVSPSVCAIKILTRFFSVIVQVVNKDIIHFNYSLIYMTILLYTSKKTHLWIQSDMVFKCNNCVKISSMIDPIMIKSIEIISDFCNPIELHQTQALIIFPLYLCRNFIFRKLNSLVSLMQMLPSIYVIDEFIIQYLR